MFSFFQKSYSEVDYPELIKKLESIKENGAKSLLFESENIKYLPAVYTMLEKMAKPSESVEKLTLYQTNKSGKYELAIFEVPWNESDIKFLPLIVDRRVSKIVGIMLPFNELFNELTKKEQAQIHELSAIWTAFVLQLRFGIK